jgi:TonB family protein
MPTAQNSNGSTFGGQPFGTPKFQPVEFQKTPWNRWAASLGINACIVMALLLVPLALNRSLQPQQKVSTVNLIPLTHFTPTQPVLRPRPIAKIVPPAVPSRVINPQPKPQPKAFEVPPPVRKSLEVKAIELPAVPVELPKPEAPKPVLLTRLEAPKPELPSVAANPVPVKVVKTGGFGDPNGVPPSTAANHGPTVQKVGAFDLAEGPGRGSGSGAGGRGKLVASAGFGDGAGSSAAPVPGGSGRGIVRGAGFGDYDSAGPPTTHVARDSAPLQTPVEITYKPKPAYTPEAREKKIEGEVLLEVLFSSAGQVQILRLIRGLGYGLDENAREAASRIRFHAATKNGAPVDVTGTVHIVFELS